MNETSVDETAGHQIKSLDFRFGVWGAVFPMLSFIVWAVVTSMTEVVTTNGLSLGAILGLILGMILCRESGHRYAQALFEGFTQTIGAVAIIAWFFAGMFSEVLQAGGLVEGLIWIANLVGAEGAIFTGLTFILASVFASAVGTGYGTVVAFGTIMYPAGMAVGGDPIVLAAAILSGAAFGDKLAPISDTTIVSAATQGADVPDVVRYRLKYVLLAALPVIVLYFIFGGASVSESASALAAEIIQEHSYPPGLWMLLPFLAVIVLAFSGFHLIVSLTWGIALGVLLAWGAGLAPFSEMIYLNFQEGTMSGALIDGIAGYVEYAILILLIVAIGHLIKLGGALEAMLDFAKRWVQRMVWRAEVACWVIVSLINTVITVNTAAEVAVAPFVRNLGETYGIHPNRRALFLDGPTSALGYTFPWSGGVLLLVTTIGAQAQSYAFVEPISPTSITAYVFYSFALLLVILISALTGWDRKYEGAQGEMTKEPHYGLLAKGSS